MDLSLSHWTWIAQEKNKHMHFIVYKIVLCKVIQIFTCTIFSRRMESYQMILMC